MEASNPSLRSSRINAAYIWRVTLKGIHLKVASRSKNKELGEKLSARAPESLLF